ncbi:MAG TPA: hypothetical protein V6D14_00865, partial [Coleofasciculaceae cyanobacterium]
IDQELKTWLLYCSELKFCAASTPWGRGGTELRGGIIEGCDSVSVSEALATKERQRGVSLALLLTADRVSAAFWKAIAGASQLRVNRPQTGSLGLYKLSLRRQAQLSPRRRTWFV